MSVKISLVVFQKDAGVDLFKTLATINKALAHSPWVIPEIVIVDDGSQVPPPKNQIDNFDPSLHKLVYLKENLGISGAIVEGTKRSSFEYVLPIPGSDMYDVVAFLNIFKALPGKYRIVIGFRSNLVKTRPPAKFVASKLLLLAFKLLTKNRKVKDIHGLNVFLRQDIIRFLPKEGGHGGQLQLLAKVLSMQKITYTQVEAPIKKSHQHRSSALPKDRRPSFHATVMALRGLLSLTRFLRG